MKKISVVFVFFIVFYLLMSCSKTKPSDNFGGQSEFFNLVSSYGKELESAPNFLSYEDITKEYNDSVKNFLWGRAPYLNWEGTLEIFNKKESKLDGHLSIEIKCLIKFQYSGYDYEFVLKNSYGPDFKDTDYISKNLKEIPIGSKVYFSFLPHLIRDKGELQDEILDHKFSLLGGIFHIGTKPQIVSDNMLQFVNVYDSLRTIHKDEYIRIADSLKTEYANLSREERIFVDEFSSFRNIYDKWYPRK